ncbi:MAG: leucine-rich repeat protein, partial [Candidatus Methanomethylophilaceae archaeon]|nr:leucine-rich repeat protein [Candidatus Methanomethylophilaceae archaeon]
DDTAAMLCSKLHEVVLDNVVSIGDAAFAWCPSLTDIDLPEGLVSMGDRVFAGAYLERVSVPSTLASVGDRSLTDLDVYDCYKTVKLAQTPENLAGKTLVKDGTAMVIQPEDGDKFSVGGVIYEMTEAIDYVVAAVGAENGVTTLDIPGEVRFGNVDYYVEGVADRAFYGNEAIVSAKVDVNIGDRAFCKCTGLKTVVLGTGCFYIDECAFYGCSSLESATFKAQSVDLGAKCFAGCGSLEEMSFVNCYPRIGSNALYGIKFLDGDKTLAKTSDNLSGRRFVGSDSILRLDLDEFAFGGIVYKPLSSSTAVVVGYEDGIRTANIYRTIYIGQDRYEVTGVEPRAFYGCPTLASLTCEVPIGERAFANCPILDSVYAASCSYVGEYAFFKCPITALHVGSGLDSTEIARSAFSECRSLGEVVFGDISSLGPNAFYRTVFYAPDAKTVLSHSVDDLSGRSFMLAEGKLVCCVYDGYKFVYGGVEYTMNATADVVAFATGHVDGIKNATILDYVSLGWNEYPVMAVASKAFYGCDSLLTADVQVDVGSKAFANCVNLRVLSVGKDDWTCSLGDYAFYGCTGLERMTFAGTVEIGNKALEKIKFYDGNALLEKNGENLSGRTFVGSGSVLKLYIEPFSYLGVKYAPQNSWQVLVTGREADVDTIWIDNYVTNDGVEYEVAGVADKAFYKDTGLKAVCYDGSGGIGNRAFANCASLELAQLWGELETIGEYAFYGCTGLDEIAISDPVTAIGKSAFSGCTGLEKIIIPSSVESIGANAFHGLSLYYADRVTPMPLDSAPGRMFEAFADRSLASDILEKDVLMFDDVYYLVGHELTEGEYDEDMYAYAVSYRPGIVEADIADLDVFGTEIPVRSVAKEAFKNCDTLTSLRVQAAEIGYKAFANCVNLADVDIGDVIIIQDYAFYGCRSIESLDVEASYVGASAFSGCVGLKDVVFGLLFYIGDNAFYKCRFFDETGTVQLDPVAENLAGNAFSGVYSKLVREVAVGDRFIKGDYGYWVTSVDDLTVEVDVFNIDDVCEIPSEVVYLGKTYAVTSMNSNDLPQCTKIVLPSTLTVINGKMEQNRLVDLVLGADVFFTDRWHNELSFVNIGSGTKFHQEIVLAGTYWARIPGGDLSYVLIGT